MSVMSVDFLVDRTMIKKYKSNKIKYLTYFKYIIYLIHNNIIK